MEKKPPFQHLRHLKLVAGGCYELRKPVEGVRQFLALEVFPLGSHRPGLNAWCDVTALTSDGKIAHWNFADNVSLRRLS